MAFGAALLLNGAVLVSWHEALKIRPADLK